VIHCLSRRDFLRLSGLAAGAVYLTPSSSLLAQDAPLVRRGPPKQVVIIGAGLAGLTAGYELTQAGHAVTILEAQTAPGGRVRTLRAPFPDGLSAELGAARIPDNHEWTLKYVKEFGLELAPFYPATGNFTTFLRETRIAAPAGAAPDLSRFPLDLTAEERALGLGGLFGKAFGDLLDHSDMRSPWPPEALERYDKMTVREFLASRGLSPGAFEALGFQAFENQSALEAMGLMRSGHGAKAMFKIVGGNDLLPKAFANRLADRIQYGAAVVRIEQDQQGVRATYRREGSSATVTADKMICAIPFTVLRHLEVAPRFSALKHQAIQEMGYASLSRITFQVRGRYWRDQQANGFANTDIPGEIWDVSFDRPGQRGLLQLYLQGPSSSRASAMTEDERLRFGIEQVERVFPGLRQHLEGAFSCCWDIDPWARGAGRFMNVGQRTFFGPHVATSEGHIHFAGEHTSAWYVWMNGAIESGSRAADEVNRA
jgi:monoamine oxidase